MAADVIWLASYPRSGNTLVRQMIHQITGFPTYSIYPDTSLSDRHQEALGHVELPKHKLFRLQGRGHPMFIKTHEKNNAGAVHPAVIVVRDGRDVCASFARYLEKKHNYDTKNLLKRAIRGNVPYWRWSDHVLSWMKPRKNQKLMFLRYEDLLEQPSLILDVLKFGGCDVSAVDPGKIRLPAFSKLHRADPNFFHSGRTWWKKVMSDELHELFWRLHGEAMRRFGYA